MTGLEIVERAKALSGYKYWYGGKREIASQKLADRLRIENPSVWTPEYYSTALKDVDGKTRVCDCSGLVCYAYNVGDVGSYTIREKYTAYTGTPKAGMIGWKKGHVGIFSADGWDAPIIEMRSQSYDYRCSRTFSQCGFTHVLYDKAVDYMTEDKTAVGWHKDGGGWWYRHTRGTGPATYFHDTFETINGHLYVFNDEGYICSLVPVSKDSETGWIN